ncbi:MAG TPA: TlpA disulfide reductase family protein [Kofleriaceae bacterium]|nr:TlpA disulfide reductase family protein [Kofleriaceae bacterium]
MSFVARLGLAILRPRAAFALAGDRAHAGRSGSDLLLVILCVIAATQLRAVVTATWLGFVVAGSLGVRALVQTLTDALVVDLGFLVLGAAAIYVASGPRREIGRAFDLACVAALPLLFVELAASLVVYAAALEVPRAMMWVLSGISYAWTGAMIALAVVEARAAKPSPVGSPRAPRRAGWGVVAIVLAGVAVQVIWLAGHVAQVRPMTAGDPAPPISLPRITGKGQLGDRVSLPAGKVTVLDFWATWCGPCLRAMPHLDALTRAHPDIAVLAINIDDADEAWSLFAERGYHMTLLAGDRDTSDRYGVSVIPHTVVIDRAGNVRRVYRGGAMDLDRVVGELAK